MNQFISSLIFNYRNNCYICISYYNYFRCYIMKYHRFMVTMKALGYSNKETVINTVLIPGIIATIFVIGGYVLGKWLLGALMLRANNLVYLYH